MSGHSRWITAKTQREQSRLINEVSEALGRIPVMVCTAHAAFVPCRHAKDGVEHVFSSAPEDIAKVTAIQSSQE